MKLFSLFILLFTIPAFSMELNNAHAATQNQVARLMQVNGMQNDMRLRASEDSRKMLAADVQRKQTRIAELEAEISAMRAMHTAPADVVTQDTSYFSTAQWDKIERGCAICGIAILSAAGGFWLGKKNNTIPVENQEKQK